MDRPSRKVIPMNLNALREAYTNNPNPNRPLKLCHGFPYTPDMTLSEKAAAIRSKLEEIASLGYGGIVTNVSGRCYLNDAEEWQLFRYALQTCRGMGLRVWIYDEKGYPSGGAGGLTLADHPEWQAQAVVILTAAAAPGETAKIAFPRGHLCGVAAYVYRAGSLDELSDEDILHPHAVLDVAGRREDISYTNETDAPVLMVYFVRKHLYEGTHAVHNVCESRRYIDVSNREAVAAFIENTYRQYALYSHGCTDVEAFFTDEPSYMGGYINEGLYPQDVHDSYDADLPLYPMVNWGADVENRFASRLGYAITDRLTYLFCGHTRLARMTRLDFYETMSALYEESFFEQISDFCAKQGIPFSGHILCEEDIRCHPVFEGNYFSLMRHMHIPGIDMLNGTPELTRRDAFTPKLISSVAHTYNRPHVMSEVSAHVQGGKVTYEEMLGTVTAQYALGVDVFTSYFSETALPAEQYRRWNNTIGRIDRIMGGGRHIAHVAIYYPIETMQANYIPAEGQLWRALDRSSEMTVCGSSLRGVCNNLLAHQLDFDFLDMYAIERASIDHQCINTTGDEHFEVLCIPACYVSDEMEVVVRHLGYKGVTVIALADEEFASDAAKLRECGANIIYNVDQLSNLICEAVKPELKLDSNVPEVIYLCRENENGRSMLLVNTSEKTLSFGVDAAGYTGVTVYDPEADEVIARSEGAHAALTMKPYQALMLLS